MPDSDIRSPIASPAMPDRWSRSLIPTLREVPAEAEVPSHRLMLRAGLIHRLGAGMYSYLPLGLRALHKVMAIVREEMANAGAFEVFMPGVIPIELFRQTGRDEAYGDNLFRLKDRHGREQALGPTHEEVITTMVASYVESYRQLPLTLYQIQTKFRDEFRPRFGVLRSREFQMKDAYSFHTKVEGEGGLDETYQWQYDAYCRIFDRCGLPYEIVQAESGPIGGSASHEFMVPSPTGEDVILKSDQGNYAANVEKCEIGEREWSLEGEPKGELEEVHTPDCTTIDDVCQFWKKDQGSKLKPQNMLKTLVCKGEDQWVIGIVRGDHDLNEGKLKAACGLATLELANDTDARSAGFAIGYVGPHIAAERDDVTLIVDPDAATNTFWVTGANKPEYHVKCFNWNRDVIAHFEAGPESAKVRIADIRNAADGDPSPLNDGGTLREQTAIEVGHVFKLGDKYSRALDVTVLDENNHRMHPIMGCYGIGVNRVLAAAIERAGTDDRVPGHDDGGIIWPRAIAPYAVLITALKYEGEVKDVADRIADEIEKTDPTIDVLIDDRDERPGVKFNDADLIGLPLRITVGGRGLKEGVVELKTRNGSLGDKGETVSIDNAVQRALDVLRSL